MNVNEAYRQVCKDLLANGFPIDGGDTVTRGDSLELVNYSFTVDDLSNNVVSLATRNTSLTYLAAETVWYWTGRNDVDFIGKFAKLWTRISDDGITNNSAYGYILKYKFGFNQIDKIIELLKTDKNTRRAVLNINTPNENVITTKDEMCTIALVFQIRDNKLNCTGIMRSNDLIYGLTYDISYFTQLQKYIAHEVGIEVGSYTHFTTSMHVYKKDFTLLENIANGNLDESTCHINIDKLVDDNNIKCIVDFVDNNWTNRDDFNKMLFELGVLYEE